MAKVGEADSRWIVSRRADGKNVGNWHWTEKNLLPWAQGRAKDVFARLLIPIKGVANYSHVEVKIKSNEPSGEMAAMNRKGKLMFIFDFSISFKWEGVQPEGAAPIASADKQKGEIKITEIANDEDKPNVKVTADKGGAESNQIVDAIKAAKADLLAALDRFLDEMKAQGEGLVYDDKEVSVITPSTPVLVNQPAAAASSSAPATSGDATASSPAPSRPNTKTFKQIIVFDVPPPPLFETLTDAGRISAFTGAPTNLQPVEGSPFSFYGNTITGKMSLVQRPNKLVQDWRFESWPKDHYSQLTLEFKAEGDKTTLSLTQTGIPSADFDRTRDGWENFFWSRIRALFGWSYKIKL